MLMSVGRPINFRWFPSATNRYASFVMYVYAICCSGVTDTQFLAPTTTPCSVLFDPNRSAVDSDENGLSKPPGHAHDALSPDEADGSSECHSRPIRRSIWPESAGFGTAEPSTAASGSPAAVVHPSAGGRHSGSGALRPCALTEIASHTTTRNPKTCTRRRKGRMSESVRVFIDSLGCQTGTIADTGTTTSHSPAPVDV